MSRLELPLAASVVVVAITDPVVADRVLVMLRLPAGSSVEILPSRSSSAVPVEGIAFVGDSSCVGVSLSEGPRDRSGCERGEMRVKRCDAVEGFWL